MLFKPMGENFGRRIQGNFISDKEYGEIFVRTSYTTKAGANYRYDYTIKPKVGVYKFIKSEFDVPIFSLSSNCYYFYPNHYSSPFFSVSELFSAFSMFSFVTSGRMATSGGSPSGDTLSNLENSLFINS